MHKKPSVDKQCIVNQGSDDAFDNEAIAAIADDNKNDASNDNTNGGNISFHFVINL
jgi:hypothetical protein